MTLSKYDKTLSIEVPKRAYGAEVDGGLYSSLKGLYKWDQGLYTDKLVS